MMAFGLISASVSENIQLNQRKQADQGFLVRIARLEDLKKVRAFAESGEKSGAKGGEVK